jgi:hypothetical protein
MATLPNPKTTSNKVRTIQNVPESILTKVDASRSTNNYSKYIEYVRSRNINFDANSLKPVCRFYPFFGGIDISKYVTPKLIEIEMISGKFIIGEAVESNIDFVSDRIVFRLCKPNHKSGPFDGSGVDSTQYKLNPYTQRPIEDSYSESSTFLNVDTKSLQLSSESEFYGNASEGMILIGRQSGATCRVKPIRLISDVSGRLIGSFYIPNPTTIGNPKFVNGSNEFLLVDVEFPQLKPFIESIASSNYRSFGTYNVTETNILTTRNIVITPSYNIATDTITTTTTNYYTVYT